MNLNKNKYLKIGAGIRPEFKGLYGRFFVYFLIRGSKIVYIGSSYNLEKRIGAHKSSLWLKKWFTRVRFIECKTHSKMLKYENRWIDKFKPKYNGRKKPSGSYLGYEEWHRLRGIPLPKDYVSLTKRETT